MKEIALQLYSIHEEISKLGFEKALYEVGKMGYTGVEFAGVGDVPAKDMKKYLDNAGLKAIGSHSVFNILRDSLEEEMEYMGELGVKYITCPGVGINSLSKIKEAVEVFNKVGEILKKNGFVFSYHNHNGEFTTVYGDKTAYDLLFEGVEDGLMYSQFDIFWLLHANIDPFEMIEKYEGKMKVMHLKQMEDPLTKEPARAGSGCIDFKKMVKRATELGVEKFIYEDEGIGTQMDNARVSAEYLLTI